MNGLIDASFAHSRTVFLLLALVLIGGVNAYHTIPKEADPDIQVPIVFVSVAHEGIAPEDAERLLVRPLERELRSVEGVKEMRAWARPGLASVRLEFETGIDIDDALAEVREKADVARAELPDDSEEPVVEEINTALFPVLVVALSGDVPERALLKIARDLERRIEALPDVLAVDMGGERDEVLEVIIDPLLVESYGFTLQDLLPVVTRNNSLVAAGTLDTGQGRFAVRVPGVFESAADVLALPVRAVGDTVVQVRDVAQAYRTFKDPEGFARINGHPAVSLEVLNRIGANVIDTVAQVRAVVEAEQAGWPDTMQVGFMQDKSDYIEAMLVDLRNNILIAILLVMIVVVAALGLRSGTLVGLAVPGSFLAGILVLALFGLSMNIVVLFSLILSVGMLVDGAIVVVEYADRKMAEGVDPRTAYLLAARRMAWPITASTATTLAAFAPLLFWPGMVGEFMKYMPITLFATLTASLLMALIFIPNLGALIGKGASADQAGAWSEDGDPTRLQGLAGGYARLLRRLLRHPVLVLIGAVAIGLGSAAAYARFGHGVEFFPDVEPDVAQVQIHARGDLSAIEADLLVQEVERQILPIAGIDAIYARSSVAFGSTRIDDDVIGVLLLEFADWRTRPSATRILAEVRARTAQIAGLQLEIHEPEAGPPVGKAVQVQLTSEQPEKLAAVAAAVRAHLDRLDGLTDVTNSRPIPGIEWHIEIDRAQAGRYDADITAVGGAIKLITNGILIDNYRPDDSDEEIDIRARFPRGNRSLDQVDRLRINTAHGAVPIANFVTRKAAPRAGTLLRVDGQRQLTVAANVADGVLPADMVGEISAWIAGQAFDPAVQVAFKGEDQERKDAETFLIRAFGVALFLIAIILVTQFNSFYQAVLVLSAVVFSTVGVLLGLLITQQPFGIVMCGVGVIALAGIVVNNNIVLIDTFNELRDQGMDPVEAVLRTGAQRLRPVMLTTVTTILGLMPMVLRLNVDLVEREITFGGPSTDWWVQLASTVAGGLAFATLLTLILTPCLLILGANVASRLGLADRSARAGQAASTM